MRQIKEFLPDIKDYYYITKNGDVISRARKKERVLKPGTKNNGYLQVSLMRENGSINYISIHRLVALAFLKGEGIVNHKDGDKKNNSLDNLEWVSQKENIRHSFENGLSVSRKGERVNLATISDEEARKIVELLRRQDMSDREISDITGFSVRGIISRIRRRETWKHLTQEGEVLGLSNKRK